MTTSPPQQGQGSYWSKSSQRRLPSRINPVQQFLQALQPQKIGLKMQLSYILGTNHVNTRTANIYAYRKNEVIYYLKNMFVKHNTSNKNYRIFYEDEQKDDPSAHVCTESSEKTCTQAQADLPFDAIIQENGQPKIEYMHKDELILTKYFPCGQNSLFLALKKINGFFYLSLFWTELEIPATVIKISQNKKEIYTNCTFHQKKGYIYLLYKIRKEQKSRDSYEKQQHLRIIEIHTPSCIQQQSLSKAPPSNAPIKMNKKFKTLINCAIKKTGGGFCDLDDMIIGVDHTELYMYGLDYFRQWKILYNEKAIKESNYRNVERNIKKQRILEVFWVHQSLLTKRDEGNKIIDGGNCSKNFLVIITVLEVLFVQNNELIHISQIPDRSLFHKTHREEAQMVLQKSLNQIYKTKFRVDTITEQNQNEQYLVENQNVAHRRITSASKAWIEKAISTSETEDKSKQSNQQKISHKSVRFCASYDSNRIFIYRICNDFTIKMQACLNSYSEHSQGIVPKQNHLKMTIRNISVSPQGTLILLTDSAMQNFINNRSQDLQNSDIDPIYTVGHGHTSAIRSISSPEIVNHLVTVSEDRILKIWNKGDKQRHLIIDTKLKARPLQALMHPCGFLIIVNFGHEIKIYGVVSNQFQQIFAVKTNDHCSSMQFCRMFNFLITNEKNMIKIYDPFTLHSFGKIQPDDLRLQYKKFRVSQNGEYIVYQCCNNKVYRLPISTMFCPESTQNPKQSQFRIQHKSEQQKQDKPTFCHRQPQQYTCFYFNFGTVKQNQAISVEGNKNQALSNSNIFIGFTKTKYMAIYSNFGQNLMAEFPVVNGTYVTDCSVVDQLMFLSNNKGSILVYQWPIQQSHLEIEIINEKSLVGRFKPPKVLHQFKVWRDGYPITNIHKISNKNELVVGGIDGIIGFVDYTILKNGNEVFETGSTMLSSERNKMIYATNNIKLVKVTEIQKITKLIEKTENDIEKIQYQIQNQKDRKNKQSQRDKLQLKMNAEKKSKIYQQERDEKFVEQEKELTRHKMEYENKKKELERLMARLQSDCKEKVQYERNRTQEIRNEIENEKKKHKNRILNLIDTHKINIKKLKDENLFFVKSLQQEFQSEVSTKYNQEGVIVDIKELDDHQLEENEQINIQKLRVSELEQIITRKTEQFKKIENKAELARRQDEDMQKKFEKNLQNYNQYRYENLVLHSELLKIQNQLYERKQILSKKDEIINMAYQEKEINETFKQFVSGAICGLEDQKGKAYKEYVKKEQDLRMLFEQLTLQINKSQVKKLKLVEQNQTVKIYERQSSQKSQNIKLSVQKLKSLKKYLLVQGVSEDSEQKKFYQEQQRLLSTIRWLEKRFKMNCLNQKKMTALKKSGVSQVINQNKNLLQECNQLRQQGIIYENQIEHLSKKLAQANQIIELEKKVTHQRHSLNEQNEKLCQIRKMFQQQIKSANEDIQDSQQKQ